MTNDILPNFMEEDTSIVDTPHVISDKPKYNNYLYKKFIKEYDVNNNLGFDSLQFRPAAAFTCDFGLSNGFKIINGKMEWGYVRAHQGVDRARAATRNGIEDVVINPFYANRSRYIDYGDRSYGTLISLYNDEYEFEFRIAHMNPDQKQRKHNEKGSILPTVLNDVKNRKSIERNKILGSAGSYGASSGAHTHTEIKSINEECDVCELIILEKYGSSGLKEFNDNEVIRLYREQRNYRNAGEEMILLDYQELRKDRKILFLNEHKCQYVDWDNTIKTRYNTRTLFNGL